MMLNLFNAPLTLVLQRGCNNPQTVFAPALKNAQPRDKIAPGTFNFILSPHFSENILKAEPSPGKGELLKVGGKGGG